MKPRRSVVLAVLIPYRWLLPRWSWPACAGEETTTTTRAVTTTTQALTTTQAVATTTEAPAALSKAVRSSSNT